MKTLNIQKLHQRPSAAAMIPAIMDSQKIAFETISVANWCEQYPYTPQVRFRMAYDEAAVYLHYCVSEDSVRAVATDDNGRVWEDSCCEFFSQPADDDTYYNIECNCAGTILVGCGKGREGRKLAPLSVLDKIDRWSTFGRCSFEERVGAYDWQLALLIPLSTFFQHQIKPLSGRTIRANFYKCGDALQKPHFLSWNPIDIEKPDFHRPDFFGELTFE